MAYQYERERQWIFTDEGQRYFLKVRDRANHFADYAGAFIIERVLSGLSGDSWQMLACVDRLVELEEFKYVSHDDCPRQHKVLVRSK